MVIFLDDREVNLTRTFDTPLFSSDQSIDRVLNAGLPVLLIFIDGSMPVALDAAIKALAKERAGSLLVVQMEKKESPAAAQKYALTAFPAVVTVKNGQVMSQAGNISAAELERHARFLLGEGPKPVPAAQPAAAGASRPGPQADGSSGQPVAVTDATFEQEVMRSPLPVVVDFWAPWCGPCRMVAPILDKLAREASGRLKIAKINVDENPHIAGQFGITGIPTMMVVKDGKIIDRWSGALPEPAMRSRLSSIL
jgi:thioredoxin 1